MAAGFPDPEGFEGAEDSAMVVLEIPALACIGFSSLMLFQPKRFPQKQKKSEKECLVASFSAGAPGMAFSLPLSTGVATPVLLPGRRREGTKPGAHSPRHSHPHAVKTLTWWIGNTDPEDAGSSPTASDLADPGGGSRRTPTEARSARATLWRWPFRRARMTSSAVCFVLALAGQCTPVSLERPKLQRPAHLFAEAARASAPQRGGTAQLSNGPPTALQRALAQPARPGEPRRHQAPAGVELEPGVGLGEMRSGHMPALMCQRVTGVDRKWGLLCKPLAPGNTTGMNETEVAAQEHIARELAQQAKALDVVPSKNVPAMHFARSVYRWQDSRTFSYIQHKKHYYNVHYADSSALKIETGLDVCEIGPFKFYTRFGLITEAVSGRPGADLQGADGILGFGYTDLKRSAAPMKTMTQRSRPHWNLTQPSSMRLMTNNSFTVLTSDTEGELHLHICIRRGVAARSFARTHARTRADTCTCT